jgi:hypothetical protein
VAAVPAGWRLLTLDNAVSFAVPLDAQSQNVKAIDSIFDIVRGEKFELIYDYGRSGENLDAYKDQPQYTRRSREVDGQPGHEISFKPDQNQWAIVRVLQVRNGSHTLTIRISCSDDNSCQIADELFDSVVFTSNEA